jgi:mRNA-degrading endonuclease RelE of RelBE toxin-antitoxin system
MRYAILLAPSAVRELKELPAHQRAEVRDGIERHLRHEPTKVNKSRIKRLRGLSRPQFRLRIDETRVFYDVTDKTVEVLAIVSKAQAEAWLAEHGQPDPGGAPGGSEG